MVSTPTTPLPTRALALATALRDAGHPSQAEKLREIMRISTSFGPDVLRGAVRAAGALLGRIGEGRVK